MKLTKADLVSIGVNVDAAVATAKAAHAQYDANRIASHKHVAMPVDPLVHIADAAVHTLAVQTLVAQAKGSLVDLLVLAVKDTDKK